MKIALIGYGKMGRMIEQIALSRGHEIVCRIDIDNQEDFQSQAFRTADVAIEFTAPSVAYGNVCRCFEAGVKVVSGSTGWMAAHADDVRRACNEGGSTLFWSSNFSIGVYIFNTINRQLARIMNGFPQYAPRMEEVHHIHKLDHPSGTAITLAETLISEVERLDSWQLGRLIGPDDAAPATSAAAPASSPSDSAAAAASTAVSAPGGSPAGNRALPIDSIRRGEVPGIHSITWNSEADQITITHDAHSRQGFALGAVLAAEYTASHTGLLTMDDMFQFTI